MNAIPLLLVLLSSGAPGSPSPESPPPKDLPALQEALRTIFARHKVAGASVVVFNPEANVLEVPLGVANRQTGDAVTPDTPFRFGSVSKLLVALAYLRLAEAGKVRVEDPLSRWVPQGLWSNPYESTHPVTLAHLLEHTAGFDDMHFSELYAPRQEDMPLAELMARGPGSKVSRWEPGTRMAYSNPGYGMAGLALERVAGEPFETTMDRWVLGPLGIPQASFRSEAARRPGVAVGYQQERPQTPDAICHRPAGALVASARDLARVGRMLLGRGALDGSVFLRPESIQRMEEAHTMGAWEAGVRNAYGLGNYTILRRDEVLHGHAGAIDGFSSVVRYSAARGLGFVVVFNDAAPGDAQGDMLDALAGYIHAQGPAVAIPEPVAVPEATLLAREGWYQSISPRSAFMAFVSQPLDILHITPEQGGLLVQPGQGETAHLVPAGDALMRERDDPVPTWWFRPSADGSLQLVHGDTYQRLSTARMLLVRAQMPGTLLVLLPGVPVLLLWGLVMLVLNRRRPARPRWFLRTLMPTLMTGVLLAGMLSLLVSRESSTLTDVSLPNVALLLFSTALPVAVVWQWVAVLRPVTAPWLARAWAVLGALTGAVLLTYMVQYGLIALQMWNH